MSSTATQNADISVSRPKVSVITTPIQIRFCPNHYFDLYRPSLSSSADIGIVSPAKPGPDKKVCQPLSI